ncbi:hypothetical protein CDN99_20140 [Roseateles aquatilis]|uniref:Uncharacterized protein n=2 Tax=Roseateles aquatilis TaxID=431061 RepID=A0A246J360_9BURK|nr:hypothetical protein CDN99_20140 [Roseateles aquatilis]
MPAHAGNQTGRIKTITIRASDGLVYFVLENAHQDKPACATGDYWMIKDENSAAGKRQLAVLIAARSMGQPVTAIGPGTCTRWADGEDLNELYM